METQIPEYRAKKIDSDDYVKGYLTSCKSIYEKDYYITKGHNHPIIEIDPSTLAIHFPDMIDSEGTRIFASLSEDGTGGDRFNAEPEEVEDCMFTVIFKNGYKVRYDEWDETLRLPEFKDFYMEHCKLTGVQNAK